jgi:hypothetical protein
MTEKNFTGDDRLTKSDVNIYSYNKNVYISLKNKVTSKDGKVQVFNILGKKVFEKETRTGERLIKIPLHNQQVGYYLVKFIDGKDILTEKILLR